MQTGIFLPIFDELADPATLARLAARAEDRGWDGVFLWDHVLYRPPTSSATDPWIALAAMAAATDRVQIGPMVTPLARRRPWIVARQAVAIDQLSGGRFVLGLGLGLDGSRGELSRASVRRWTTAGRRRGCSTRAWRCSPGCWRASTSTTTATITRSRTSRSGRRPPGPGGCRSGWRPGGRTGDRCARALRHDGVFLIDTDDPGTLAEIVVRPGRRAPHRRFDIVVTGLPGDDVSGWRAAGATWWLADFDAFEVTVAAVETAIDAGPPA